MVTLPSAASRTSLQPNLRAVPHWLCRSDARRQDLGPSRLSSALLLLVACIASSQESTPAVAGTDAGQPTPMIEGVEVTARREALRQAVTAFVSGVTRADGAYIARWREPICPWVSGTLPAQGDFVESRVGEIAKSVGARVNEDTDCRSNLLVFLTTDPNELVTLFRTRSPRTFHGAASQEIDDFLHATRPVRVWQNSGLQNADGSPPGSYANKPQYRLRDSRIVSSVAEEFAAVIVVVDTDRTGTATFGQLADYVAMIALAQIDMDAELADAPTILRLFANASQQDVPRRLTDWDHAFLKAVYCAGDSYLQDKSDITRRMTHDLDSQH